MLGHYDSDIELEGDVVVLSVSGETDLATAPELRSDLDEAIEATSGDVVLDLTDLELVDSTALGIMIAAAGRLMTERRSLAVVVAREHLLRVFETTGLHRFFSIAGPRDEAMARLLSARVSRRVA
jgi:anti-sigma B factor antagonist